MKNFLKFILFFLLLFSLNSCASNKRSVMKTKEAVQLYNSTGFVLIYNEDLYKKKIVNKKLNNLKIEVIHSELKRNTNI